MINRIYQLFLVFLITSLSLYGQDCDSCKTYFDTLLLTLNKPKISNKDLQNCWRITSKLYKLRFVDYPEEINGEKYDTHSLSRTYADICISSRSQVGVDYYLKYMRLTKESVEEERSIDFERIFVKYPEFVLKRIGNDKDLLNALIFGFISNRNYGAKNPCERNDYNGETYYENSPTPILTPATCRKIFFETNPSLRAKYNEYKYQIDYLINSAVSCLKKE
jgi:hypothetical protein